ncbi:hypothetical protein ACLB2K_024636 [Fragaria x ananassa]
MTIFRRIILRTARTQWSVPAVPQSLNPPPRACSCDVRLLCHRCFEQPYHSNASEIQVPKFVPGQGGPGRRYLMYPTVLAGLIGLGGLEVAYADAEEAASKQGFPADAPVSDNVEDIAKKQRQDIEDLLKSKGMQRGTYPDFTVSVKGQKVTIKFQIPSSCEASQVIANIASNLGLKVEENGGGSDISLRAWDSGVAWQLLLMHPEKKKKTEGDQGEVKDVNEHERDLHILVFRSVISSTEKTEIEFMKQGSLGLEELDALISALQLAGAQKSFIHRKNYTSTTERRAREGNISWDNLAGYDLQKRQIEDTILLALLSPETYDDIARGTRRKYESNRPRAVLFEGPPGTGKTSSARVIANQAGVPMLYVPLEVILSKYYGESERLLGKVFSLANELPSGAIIFLDEVDSFATSRDSDLHEATRRVLSVLLRQIDGFEQDKKVVVIAATNRKQDLDPALISRFDSIILFCLPDHQNRKEIAAQYAKHLTQPELDELTTVTEEMSGRDIRDVCQQAERSWASKLIRGLVPKDGDQIRLPPLPEYIASAMNRHKGLLSSPRQQTQNSKSDIKKAGVVLD